MKRNRTLTVLLALVMALLLAYGCAAPAVQPEATPQPQQATQQPAPTQEAEPAATPEQAAQQPLKVAALKGPTGMGMASLMGENEAGNTQQPYAFTLAAAPDEIVGKFVNGEVDIAAAPINLAASLYKKTGGQAVMIAVNTLGVLYVLENGDTVQSMADLAGKTLYATGQGSTPEYVLHYLLEKNGILDQVTVEYYTEHAELASLLAAGEANLGLLPEPNVTATMLKNQDLRIALNLTQEWDKVAGGTKLVQGCIIAQKSLVESNPQAVATFLEEYAASVEAVNNDPAAAGALIEKYEIMASAAAAAKAIPNANIVCLTGEEMKQDASAMLQVLFDADPKSVGGELPDDGLYYLG